jgi:uncharacterized protein YlzI (FlbEa/FlbD family)
MIRLTRLRNSNPLFLNPDHIERLEQYHETTVHMFNGDEFVVTETAEQIVDLITTQRAEVLSLASRLATEAKRSTADENEPANDPAALDVIGSTGDTGAGSVSAIISLADQEEGS